MASIATPCIQVCILDPQRSHCIGCGRSVAEIAGWIGLTDNERAIVMADLPRRLLTLQPGTASIETHKG